MSAKSSRFSVLHLLYATAVLGSGLAAFGPIGLFLGAVVIFVWRSFVFHASRALDAPPREFKTIDLLVLLAVSGLGFAELLPAGLMRNYAVTSQSRENLERISRALRSYHDEYGSLPPAYYADERGRPAHSWRVLILPQLGYQSLFEQYHLDEAWDSPRNARIFTLMPEEFKTGLSDWQGMSSAMAVTGERTAWPGAAARRFDEIADDRSETLLVVAIGGRSTPWTAPDDLELEEAVKILASRPPTTDRQWKRGFASSTHPGARAISVAGDVAYLGETPSVNDVRRRFVIDDEKDRSDEGSGIAYRPWRRFHYGKLLALAIFVACMLLPIRSLRRVV